MGKPANPQQSFQNPFRPGAGHTPPYLAGREDETNEFRKMLLQKPILQNAILTGLRGTGKTVLLETWKPIALREGWLWTGTDLTESASVSEEVLAIRIMADLAPLIADLQVPADQLSSVGFGAPMREPRKLTYEFLYQQYNTIPGLVQDKLKGVLEFVWSILDTTKQIRGIVFAYDEAQNLADHSKSSQFPLSLLLDVFSSLQRKDIPVLLVLTGLPTLSTTLVEARAYAERMFHVIELHRLTEEASRQAILRPIKAEQCPVSFSEAAVLKIIEASDGYPYFIQFICRESYDIYLQQQNRGVKHPEVSLEQILNKLDVDFYSGRWNNLPDRQRELLVLIAGLANADQEFTVQQIMQEQDRNQREGIRAFSASSINQTLALLIRANMVYKNRHGRYSLAVPMLSRFIKRQKVSLY